MPSSTKLSCFEITHQTPRLTLKTLKNNNQSERYLYWMQDQEILQYLEVRHNQQTQKTINDFVQNTFENPDNLLLGIFSKDKNKHIGNIKLGPVNWTYMRADIGLLIGEKDYWGHGLATEAIKGVSEIAFQTIKLSRIHAGAYASNQGSVKAFLNAGFEKEGVQKAHWILNKISEDNILMGKLSPSLIS